MGKLLKEFKEFAFRGNVIDMAVGVMIGSAFTAIVNSLVKDVFTPLISVLTNGIDFQTLSITLAGEGETALLLTYGAFIQAVINFFLVAICIFFFVKFINKLRTKKAAEPAPAPAPAAWRCRGRSSADCRPYRAGRSVSDAVPCP